MKKQIRIALLVAIAISATLPALSPHRPSALAQFSWTDTINIHKDVQTVYHDIRKITNNESVPVDVKVQLTFTEKADLLKHYRLSANGTDFITILQGLVTTANNTYYGLKQGQALSFTVEAEGSNLLSIDDVVTIGVRVEFWSAEYIHDIAITALTLPKTVVGQGFLMKINTTVENQGNFTETFNVTLYANTTIIQTSNITLQNEDSTTITFTWNTTNSAKGNYTIHAYAHPVPGETEIGDNNFTDGWIIVAMVGDITGPKGWPDGKVDIRDIAAIAILFGVNYPDPRYDANYDIIYDGKIDIKDIATAAIRYGQLDP